MLQIHPTARTTPAVRAEIARSREPSGTLARRFGVSSKTIRKWRKRGPEDCLDPRPGLTSCPGRRRMRSAPWSVPCAGPPTSPSTTSPSS